MVRVGWVRTGGAICAVAAVVCAMHTAAFAANPATRPADPGGYIDHILAQEYHAGATAKGLQAPNRANNFRTYFDGNGIRIVDRTAPGNLVLAAIAFETLRRGKASVMQVGESNVVHRRNRVEIHRGDVTEWYENTPLGLEQGFTLRKQLAGRAPLRLFLKVSHATAHAVGDSIQLRTATGRCLSYGHLKVTDANGRPMAARMSVPSPNRIVLSVSDTDAVYPIVIDPLIAAGTDTVLTSDQAVAGMGFSLASAGDINDDGFDDVIVGAPYYDSGQTDEGAAFIFHGSAAGISTAGASSAQTLLQSDQDTTYFGYSVDSAGDVNNDGFDDVVVGAPTYDDGESDEGAAFVFLGSASGIANANPAAAHAVFQGNQTGAQMGEAVASAGDVNGDGFADIIISAHIYDKGETDEGAAFVFHGSATGMVSGSPATAQATLESNQASAQFGTSVACAGDVNNDGYDDVIVGALYFDNGEADEGTAYVFHGSATGVASASPATAHAVLQGNQTISRFGAHVASAGDVNDDGYADVIVSAPYYSNGELVEGAAFVFHGSATGIGNGDPASADAFLESDQVQAQMGSSVASAGDVNGDGYADVIVGARFYDNGQADEGAAFVFLGGGSGIQTAVAINAHMILEGNQASAVAGRCVASAGDINGDGYSDVIVGADGFDDGQSGEGAAFIFLGSAMPHAMFQSNQADAYMGLGVASAGDVNDDGFDDVIVGAPYFDNGQSSEGAAFVFHGSASGIANFGAIPADTFLESNQANSMFGNSVASAGDVNNDGYDDVIIGASSYDDGQANEGAAFVFHGSASGISTGSGSTAQATMQSNQQAAEFGSSVASAGDINGDGFDDVIVAAPNYDNVESNEGSAFLFLGSSSGVSGTTPATAHATLETNQADATVTSVATAGDVNKDGYADVIFGSPYYNAGLSNEGAAFVFHGSAAGIPNGSPATADTRIEGGKAGGILGHRVSTAGDVNGDGYADVIVGAPWYSRPENGEGIAAVFLGSSTGVADGTPDTAHAVVEGNQVNAQMGYSVATAGDVNGDGYGDVIVGSVNYTNGQSLEGVACIYHGSAAGISSGGPAVANRMLEADQGGSTFGETAASAGDVNGDGADDVIVGAANFRNGQGREGSAFLFLGTPPSSSGSGGGGGGCFCQSILP